MRNIDPWGWSAYQFVHVLRTAYLDTAKDQLARSRMETDLDGVDLTETDWGTISPQEAAALMGGGNG